jgi:hypothetical protein
MSEVATTTTGGALGAYGGADPFAAAAAALGAGEGNFLKFNGNTGDFTYGQKDEELPHGTQLAADMLNFARGWICWKDGEVEDEIMVPILKGEPPLEHTLPDHGPYEKHDDGSEDGWAEQAKIGLRDVETGETYLYKTTSKSGRRALGQLLKDFSKLHRMHPGETPVVEISGQSYTPKDKKLGKKFAPIFKIVGWMNDADLAQLDEGSDAPETAKGGADDPANYEQQQQQPAATETTATAAASRERTETPTTQPTDAPAAAGRRAKRF